MNLPPKLTVIRITFLLFLSCVATASPNAQNTGENSNHGCFVLHVRLNGKALDDPRTITLKTKDTETSLSLQGGCFMVPPALLKEKTLDVAFTVPKNKVDLSDISSTFFRDAWEIDLLDDKRFRSDVVLPKHARIKEACFVVFHGSEPERQLSETGCRSPLRNGSKADGQVAHP